MCVVKYACASVILLSVIKLTRKLSNNLTGYWQDYRKQTSNEAALVIICSRPGFDDGDSLEEDEAANFALNLDKVQPS
jgi:hypothetical protein